MLKWMAGLMLAAAACTWAGNVAAEDLTLPDARSVKVPGDEGEAPAEAVAVEPFDLDKLLATMQEFDATLYAGQQDKLAGQLSGRIAPHAAELMEKYRAEKEPSIEFIRLLGFVRTDEARAERRKLLDAPDASRRAAAAFAAGVSQDEIGRASCRERV